MAPVGTARQAGGFEQELFCREGVYVVFRKSISRAKGATNVRQNFVKTKLRNCVLPWSIVDDERRRVSRR
jgi:hypothetical protein